MPDNSPDEPQSQPARSEAEANVSRRGFIKSCGASGVALAIGGGAQAQEQSAPKPTVTGGHTRTKARLQVNGRQQVVLVEPRYTLLHVLREQLGLTAAKPGCERGECGACTVLIDDRPRYACLTLALEAEGGRIETAEGLMDGEALGPVQQAFVDKDGLQCGYCTPGQVMAAEGLLRTSPAADFDQIRRGMSGNLCRCGAYSHIFEAVAAAAEQRQG